MGFQGPCQLGLAGCRTVGPEGTAPDHVSADARLSRAAKISFKRCRDGAFAHLGAGG